MSYPAVCEDSGIFNKNNHRSRRFCRRAKIKKTMRKELEKKINQAIRLLQSIPTDKGDIELSYSGGKDSDVILRLAQMAGVKVRVIYKSTSIDPPGTIPHVIKNGAEVIRPKKTFFKLVEGKGYPSRFVRFCCQVLKEYKICDTAIQGIRRSESRARSDRYQEPQICRHYRNKSDRVSVFLPILDWTDEDVEEFIKEQAIECAPVYYDNEGCFHVERRLGCMCCPLASRKKRLEEFHKHPRMVRRYIASAAVIYKKKGQMSNGKFINPIDQFVAILYFDSYLQFCEKTYGIFGKFDWRKYLEEEFSIRLDDIDYTYETQPPVIPTDKAKKKKPQEKSPE